MSVKEVLQALGNWAIGLRPETPRELIREIEQNKFGHIAIFPGRVNPREYNDGLLRKARYVGVYRSTFKQSDDSVEIKGVGMAFWLGDEDGKGDIFETPVILEDVTFPNAVRALLPASGSVREGTLHSIPGAGLYSKKHQWETPRAAITYVTETFTTSEEFTGTERIVEFRVNGDATLDAGRIEDLYNVTPKAILVKRNTGRDMRLLGLQSDMSMDYDVEDLTTRVVVLAQGEGDTIPTGSADATPSGYKDLFGNPIKQTRLVSESDTPSGNANTRAQLQLIRWSLPRQAIQLRTQEFDIKGDFAVGDYIYVFDPEAGFFDLNKEVFWRGQPINPMVLRVKEMDWQVRPNWTIAFRKNNGEWIDLSQYYRAELGGSTLAVGDYRRTLAGNNYEPLGFRPNLPPAGADSTIPAAPEFTGFSSGSYESEDRTFAAILAQWSEPLNLDGSTIQDGDHYEIRYRPNAIVGSPTPWDYLSGGYDVDFEDTFSVDQASNWGPNWPLFSGSLSVAGGEGRILHPTFNTIRGAQLTGTWSDAEVVSSSHIDYVPAGASTVMGVRFRRNGDNYYWSRVEPNTDSTITLKLSKHKTAFYRELVSMHVPGLVHQPNLEIHQKVTFIGDTIAIKVWQGTLDDEPDAETANVWDQSDPILPAGIISQDDYLVAGATNPAGVSTRHSYFRVRSLVPDDTADAFSWDDLGSWDALTSEPVTVTPIWSTAYVPWDQLSYTITDLGPGIQYEFQIRGVDNAKPPNFGPWSASEFVRTTADAISPSTPAAPEVASSMIAIQVTHQLGRASGGIFNLEVDLGHFDVHVGGDANFAPEDSNKVGELLATGAMVRGRIPSIGTFKVDNIGDIWVKVVAVDRSGNKSGASIAVQSSADLIDDQHISSLSVSKLTAGTITANTVLAAEMEVGAGGNIKLTDGSVDIFNNLGVKSAEFGKLEDNTYGIALINPFGQFVKLHDYIFGPQKARKNSVGITSSQSYTNLSDGSGPAVSNVTIGETGRAIVTLTAYMEPPSGGMSFMGVEIKNQFNTFTINPDDFDSLSTGGGSSSQLIGVSGRMSVEVFVESLPPDVYTFTAKYRVLPANVGDEAVFANRVITVQPY